jgi:hypothetical protein
MLAAGAGWALARQVLLSSTRAIGIVSVLIGTQMPWECINPCSKVDPWIRIHFGDAARGPAGQASLVQLGTAAALTGKRQVAATRSEHSWGKGCF